MTAPQLYVQIFEQLRQWICPAARRQLQGVAEAVSGILQLESGCPSHWLPYLDHRNALFPTAGQALANHRVQFLSTVPFCTTKQFVTDDMDYAIVTRIQMFTTNQAVINVAQAQGKLLVR